MTTKPTISPRRKYGPISEEGVNLNEYDLNLFELEDFNF